MTVIVPHHSTEQNTVAVMDKALDKLLAGAGGASVQIVGQKKTWNGSVMTFSFTAKLGFIAVPMAGTIQVDRTNVTVDIDLPPMVKNFVGEEKVRTLVDENVRNLLAS